jgi:hypothetical protein
MSINDSITYNRDGIQLSPTFHPNFSIWVQILNSTQDILSQMSDYLVIKIGNKIRLITTETLFYLLAQQIPVDDLTGLKFYNSIEFDTWNFLFTRIYPTGNIPNILLNVELPVVQEVNFVKYLELRTPKG